MMARGIILIFFVTLCGSSAETIRVATLNLQNYLSMDRVADGQWRTDYPKCEEEKALIRDAIIAVNPDVLVLQEIGELPYLEELRKDLDLDGLNYIHAIHMVAADEERHLAMLSRIGPKSIVRHVDLEFQYFETRELVKRGMLEVEFVDSSGVPFQVFGVHLKSRWSDEGRDPDSALRRAREAEACRDRVIERTLDRGQYRFLVAGDFNDHPRSSAVRRFERRGDLMIGALLPAADSRGHLWTHFYRRESSYGLVDGFVVSSDLMPDVLGQYGHIHDWPIGRQGSDHRMVYFDLEFSKD